MSDGQKQENRGGFRAGAGRKPGPKTSLSAHQVKVMLRKAKKAARKHGKDVDDIILEFIYDGSLKAADRLATIKLFKEYTAPKPSEGGDADKQLGPSVFLPAQHPKLKLVETGKAA